MSLKHKLIDLLFALASYLSRITVITYLFDRNLSVQRNITYKTDVHTNQSIRLDCIESTKYKHKKPIIVHIHGGGFKDFSKDTHSHVAAKLARMGYYVVNINYRTIPPNPYPASLDDVRDAMQWVYANLNNTKVDINEVYMLGESAGANLILAYVLSQLEHKDENIPKKLILSCGLFEVSTRAVNLRSTIVAERLKLMRARYIKNAKNNFKYIDLLSTLESYKNVFQSFPKTLIQIGTNDVLYEQSILLNEAMKKLKCDVELKEYKGRGHALHAIPFAKGNDKIYTDMNEFLKKTVNLNTL